MPRLPDALRTELADSIERILGPDVNLQALAREMDDATGAIRTRAWMAPRLATSSPGGEVYKRLQAIPGHEPDVTLLTAEAGSPVYMQRWWLRRDLTKAATARTACTCTSSRTTTPNSSTTTRGRRPRCCSPAAPSSKTRTTEPR